MKHYLVDSSAWPWLRALRSVLQRTATLAQREKLCGLNNGRRRQPAVLVGSVVVARTDDFSAGARQKRTDCVNKNGGINGRRSNT
jgi:hypothetical protein